MKGLRHAKIKEIIDQHMMETQEDLAAALRSYGIDVTQATVSRDIKELMLIKVPTGDGHYRYAFPSDQGVVLSQARMERIFQDSVISVLASENLVIIRTLPGTAQAVAYTIDYVRWPEILGTIAGDDTIFVAASARNEIDHLLAKFRNLL
ncbi:MAG: arginine repressor [Acidaminococcales bacterium]|jgi:transcriptional regulator of arginine metabolism|nr:arginine repressor [Acidaminococcales bacterium]